MLYIFLVDTGTMLTFEMNLAMQRVRDLQEVIARECRVPQEKQVLLISGGDSLDPNERVCRYAAGTDSNPIFLFNKQSLESATSPLVSIQYGAESHLKERLEDSLTLTASYDTLAARTGLAANFHEIAKEDLLVCQRLVFDQHLQHQGWLAVIANLEDVTHAFEANNKLVFQQFHEFLSQRDENLKLLDRFPAVVGLLAKIPLLQSLDAFSLASIVSSGPDDRPKTLLAWITAQETNKTLEQMMTKCKSDLEQFEEHTYKNLAQDIEGILAQVDNVSMKEVRGLEGRLFQLDYFMQAAAKLVAEQEQIFKAIENNQSAAIHVQDPTVLPELCEIHKHQMPQMLRNHDQLQEIKSKCRCAKVDLSENLHKRLRWVMYVEKGLTEVNSRIFFYKEMLHRLKHHLEIIRQISTSPEVYGRSVAEVVRRRRFSSEFAKFSKNLSERCRELRHHEMGKRKDFHKFFHCHFLNALFPGFDDIPPNFATKCPDPFDDRLPLLTEHDVVMLNDKVPELVESLRTPEYPSMSVADLLPCRTVDVPATASAAAVVGRPLPSAGAVEPPAILDPEPMFDVASSQSVIEIIAAEESRLAALCPTGSAAAGEAASTGRDEDGKRAGSPGGRSMEALPELEEGNPANDAFMTADFYFDESMPSSMTELASSKKLAELQCILQDRTTQLEQKEREVMDSRRCIDELNTKILLYEKTTKLMNDAVLGCCAPLKQDLEDVRTSVVVNRSQSLVELSTVHGSLVELVRTWNVTSEQVALDSARSFDESLTAVRVKLDAESESLSLCVGENHKLRSLLEEKSSECRVLGDEVQRLKGENDVYRKAVLELELENEKLHSDYKTDVEAKDDTIRALRQMVNDTAQVKCEETARKVESEVLSMRDEMKRELVANEARVAGEIAMALSEKHRQELIELQTEFQHRLIEKEEAIKLLSDSCRGYAERQKDFEMESAGKLVELQKDNDVRLKAESDKNVLVLEEMNAAKREIEKLIAERDEHVRCVEKLNCAVEEINGKHESRKNLEERESQTGSADMLDAETQTEVATQDVGIQAEIETARVDVATDPDEGSPKSLDGVDAQTDALEDTHDVEIQAASDTRDAANQIVPVVRDVEIQTDRDPDIDEIQSGLLLRSNVGGEAFTESTRIDRDNELYVTLCRYSESEKLEETFETGMCELRSCASSSSVPTETKDSEGGFALQLRVDDYLPLQRHDEVVARLKAQMEEEKTAAILRVQEDLARKFEEEKLLLKANLEARRQINFNEALNRAVAERDIKIDTLQKKILELSSAKVKSDSMLSGAATIVQEFGGARRSVEGNIEEDLDMCCQGQSRLPSGPLSSSGMALSFVPLMEASAQDRSVVSCPVQSHAKQTVDRFKEMLMELSVSSSVSDYLMQYVSISRCKEHDIVFFVWNDTLGHYLAYLVGNQIQHFLHGHSASHIEQQSSEFKALHKWLIGEVVHNDLCLAKKETNRFHLPVGTKFFRVKAKPWTPSSEFHPKSSPEEQATQKRATSKKLTDDKS